MKVYVENLPKSCLKCPFYKLDTYVDVYGYQTNSHECVLDGSMLTNSCPLQSLADYTKQVRKEVLEQVYKVFTTEDVWSEFKSWWLQSGTCEELKACLDAMVEETSVENIMKKFGRHKAFYQMLNIEKGETECQKN